MGRVADRFLVIQLAIEQACCMSSAYFDQKWTGPANLTYQQRNLRQYIIRNSRRRLLNKTRLTSHVVDGTSLLAQYGTFRFTTIEQDFKAVIFYLGGDRACKRKLEPGVKRSG